MPTCNGDSLLSALQFFFPYKWFLVYYYYFFSMITILLYLIYNFDSTYTNMLIKVTFCFAIMGNF